MRTGTAPGEFGGTSGQQPDFELLLQLTDVLCELGCVEDVPSRVQFAGLLDGQLRRQVDIRGVRLREDVVSLVTAALSVAGGEHVLVGVVRILEGAPAGDELDRLISPAPTLAGPLSKDDEKSARVALSRGDLPAARLRDGLAEELAGLDVPDGLTPEQLFAHLLEWNVQEDGLPPVVLLLDHAARLAGTAEHRLALTGWVDVGARPHPGRLAAGGGPPGRTAPRPHRRRPAPHRVAAAQRRARPPRRRTSASAPTAPPGRTCAPTASPRVPPPRAPPTSTSPPGTRPPRSSGTPMPWPTPRPSRMPSRAGSSPGRSSNRTGQPAGCWPGPRNCWSRRPGCEPVPPCFSSP